jgi:hypothetical protein
MADGGEESRVVDFGNPDGRRCARRVLVHPGPGGPAVILVVGGGPAITVELDMGVRQQLDTVLRDLVH